MCYNNGSVTCMLCLSYTGYNVYFFDETIQFATEKQCVFTEHPLCKHVTKSPAMHA